MNKTQLVGQVYDGIRDNMDILGYKLTKRQVEDVIDIAIETVKTRVADGEQVKIGNFLTLDLVDAAERSARNPKTGETILVPAKKKIKVKISSNFKEFVLENQQ